MDCIADLLGPRAEVVLHDVRFPEKSVVRIRNGHVTGRTVGAPLTDLGFYMLRESDRRIETLGVYQSKTDNGKLLQCNAVNLRDNDDRIEGILCINIDATADAGTSASRWSSRFTEHYQTSIDQVINGMIAEAAASGSGELTPEAKPDVVRALDARGVFLARGAVRQVASALKIAAPTVYKYIQNGRRGNKQSRPPQRAKATRQARRRAFRAPA